jgi:hypothetical protein
MVVIAGPNNAIKKLSVEDSASNGSRQCVCGMQNGALSIFVPRPADQVTRTWTSHLSAWREHGIPKLLPLLWHSIVRCLAEFSGDRHD